MSFAKCGEGLRWFVGLLLESTLDAVLLLEVPEPPEPSEKAMEAESLAGSEACEQDTRVNCPEAFPYAASLERKQKSGLLAGICVGR